jgi:hypothetical protein
MRYRCGLFGLSILLLVASLPAQAQTPLGESLKDIEVAPHWIYDDLPAAVDEAKTSGKPLLVVLRCVPCPPGRSLDQKVMQPDRELEAIEKQFICVRVIQTNSLDLDLFQYDYDMSWAAMFLNADGTIYGRYGSRNASGPGSDSLLSPAAFRNAAQRALDLHKAYPGNKGSLAAKRGPRPEYLTPRDVPGLGDKPAKAMARQECIHCHMVREFALRAKWEEGRLTEADLWVYPMPEQIGLELDLDDGLLVSGVRENSPAAAAGIESGDELLSLNNQPLVSMADVQWVLHTAPPQVELPATLRRAGRTVQKSISLSGDWKKSDIGWRASSWYGLRQGVKFEPLSPEEKEKRGIDSASLALLVKGLFGKGGPKVQQAGLRMNDVIVAVNGKSAGMSESDFLAYLRLHHGPRDSVTFTLLRGDDRRELTIPLW